MLGQIDILYLLKYVACVLILIGIVLAPAWLARQNARDKYDMLLVRIYNWLFGWTGVGWLIALVLGVKK